MRSLLVAAVALAAFATSGTAAEPLPPVLQAKYQANCSDCDCASPGCTGKCGAACGGCQSCQGACGACSVPGCQGCRFGRHCGHCGGLFGFGGCIDGSCEGGCFNTCNMPPHYAYFPADHGNYYFRPYNYHRIATHQQFVMTYGGNPRHPYANEVFDRVYETIGEELLEEAVEDALERPAPIPMQAPIPTPAVPPTASPFGDDAPLPPVTTPDRDARAKMPARVSPAPVSVAQFVRVPAPRLQSIEPVGDHAVTGGAVKVQFVTPAE
ncbi:MAG: hypothetical protein KDA47_21675 [Planctomycetales bacterium]|nr:hypothetical protein [Planctomycetales bacterium]